RKLISAESSCVNGGSNWNEFCSPRCRNSPSSSKCTGSPMPALYRRSGLRAVRGVHARRGDLLEFLHAEQVVVATVATLPAVRDATVLGEHAHVGVQHAVVRVASVIALDLRVQLRPAVLVAHLELDVSGHVAFKRVVVV